MREISHRDAEAQSGEHPFEVACKLARSLAERGERATLRAQVALAQYYSGRGAVVIEAANEPKFMDQVLAKFNGHPLSVGKVAEKFPGARHRVNTALVQLALRGDLKRVETGIYQRAVG